MATAELRSQVTGRDRGPRTWPLSLGEARKVNIGADPCVSSTLSVYSQNRVFFYAFS